MAEKRKLRDRETKETVYPITAASCVVFADGETLEEKWEKMQGEA